MVWGEYLGEIAILDAGAQYGNKISQAVTAVGISSDRLPIDTPIEQLRGRRGVIISGSGDSVNAPGSPRCDPRLLYSGIPILGNCYGMQLIATGLGGRVVRGNVREDDADTVRLDTTSLLFQG